MDLLHIPRNLEKLFSDKSGFFKLETGASKNEIRETEMKLNLSFPAQVKLFYETYNGLMVENPSLCIHPLEKMKFTAPGKLEFAIFDEIHPVCFDVTSINHGGQWNIVAEKDFLVTFTMASFWSNKIWAWLRNRRTMWKEEVQSQP